MHARSSIAKENLRIHVSDNGISGIIRKISKRYINCTNIYPFLKEFFSPVNGTRGKNIVGIVSKIENSTIELKCPICNSEETCNTSE